MNTHFTEFELNKIKFLDTIDLIFKETPQLESFSLQFCQIKEKEKNLGQIYYKLSLTNIGLIIDKNYITFYDFKFNLNNIYHYNFFNLYNVEEQQYQEYKEKIWFMISNKVENSLFSEIIKQYYNEIYYNENKTITFQRNNKKHNKNKFLGKLLLKKISILKLVKKLNNKIKEKRVIDKIKI